MNRKIVMTERGVLFEYYENSFIQLLGNNREHICRTVNFFKKYFSRKRYSENELEYCGGNEPEITVDGEIMAKNRKKVIVLSSMEDLIEQLKFKKDSLLYSYYSEILTVSLESSDYIHRIKNVMEEYEAYIDGNIFQKFKFIKPDIYLKEISADTVLKHFYDLKYTDENCQSFELYQYEHSDVIDIFLILIENIDLDESSEIEILLYGLDNYLNTDSYNKFLNSLMEISKKRKNLNIWNIPFRSENILISKEAFENSYVFKKEVYKMEDFELTYSSICLNYPSCKNPDKDEVIEVLLKYYPHFNQEETVFKNRKTVILKVFLELLNENCEIKLDDKNIDELEEAYLSDLKKFKHI